MKKLVLLTVSLLFVIKLSAQYVTPGTGVNWNLDDLVNHSGGVVSLEANGQYTINNDVTISVNDTLTIVTAEQVNIADAVLVTIKGTLITSPEEPGMVFFNALNDHYLGFRFEDCEGSMLSATYFNKAGGIDLVNADVLFINCDFTEFDQENSTGAIDLFQSSPVISGCTFTNNSGPAVMSGANSASSPQISDCQIMFNVLSNANMPQINLGTSGADSIRIINCEIIGDPEMIMSGGIAITTLAGGSITARIEGNIIKNNRYGITAYGYNIGSVIRNNEITDNNTQNLPMQGGSGINYWGNATNQSIVTGNIITGNLWGITIQSAAQPNLGQLEGEIYNPGMNQIYGNGNSGEVYDLYNNTPNPVMAENNYWGTMDPDSVEMHIFHQPDDPTLGLVDYLPLYYPPVTISENPTNYQFGLIEDIFPNPADNHFFIKFNSGVKVEEVTLEVISLTGSVMKSFNIENIEWLVKVSIGQKFSGIFIIQAKYEGVVDAMKIKMR